MQLLRKSRWMLFALLLSIIPASSHAGVLISVNIGPPVLPVYEHRLPGTGLDLDSGILGVWS